MIPIILIILGVAIAVILLSRGSRERIADIRSALGMSDRSVIRYMDELQQEGRVEPLGRCATGVPV